MTLEIATNQGKIKIVTAFKMTARQKKQLTLQIKHVMESGEEWKDAQSLVAKLKKEDSLIGTPRGALLAYKNSRSWTQQELSRRSKIPQADLSKIINGKRVIGPVIAKRLGVAFGVDYKKFL